jgi:predicted permease
MGRVILSLLVGGWWFFSLFICADLFFNTHDSIQADQRIILTYLMFTNAGLSSVSLFYVLYGSHSDSA